MELALQSGSIHRFPPPCDIHLSVLPCALNVQSISSHRLPPPCALHLYVLSLAIALQFVSIQRRLIKNSFLLFFKYIIKILYIYRELQGSNLCLLRELISSQPPSTTRSNSHVYISYKQTNNQTKILINISNIRIATRSTIRRRRRRS